MQNLVTLYVFVVMFTVTRWAQGRYCIGPASKRTVETFTLVKLSLEKLCKDAYVLGENSCLPVSQLSAKHKFLLAERGIVRGYMFSFFGLDTV